VVVALGLGGFTGLSFDRNDRNDHYAKYIKGIFVMRHDHGIAYIKIKGKAARDYNRNKERQKKEIMDGKDGRCGYVYIFKLGYDDLYKIGLTTDILQRLKSLKAANPKLKCVWSARVRDIHFVEQELHKAFHRMKVEREIFKIEDLDILVADKIADKYR